MIFYFIYVYYYGVHKIPGSSLSPDSLSSLESSESPDVTEGASPDCSFCTVSGAALSSVSLPSVSETVVCSKLFSTGVKLLLFFVMTLSFEVSTLLVSGIKLLTVLEGFLCSFSSSSKTALESHSNH